MKGGDILSSGPEMDQPGGDLAAIVAQMREQLGLPAQIPETLTEAMAEYQRVAEETTEEFLGEVISQAYLDRLR